jgi:hypothetical protein
LGFNAFAILQLFLLFSSAQEFISSLHHSTSSHFSTFNSLHTALFNLRFTTQHHRSAEHSDSLHITGTALAFASWDCSWDVDFKLWAPMNTTVEATLTGGKLTRFVVTPESRKSFVRLANCGPAP